MDIDEFLDRELSDLGLSTDTSQRPDPGIEAPDSSGMVESSPLFENIRAELSKGNLEDAEQSYVQLWRILLEQKLKWNSSLYEQLSILGRQFSSALNAAYDNMKNKADRIYELISRGRAAIKEGKKEMPFKIYSEIEELDNSIPNVFFEEKKIIQGQIADFYNALRNSTDNELVQRVSALIQDINQLIDKINASIRANDMVNAIVNYNKCIELYVQVPEGFLRLKNSAGMRLLDIYKSISIYNEISNLEKQLSQMPSQPKLPQPEKSRTAQIIQPYLQKQLSQMPSQPKLPQPEKSRTEQIIPQQMDETNKMSIVDTKKENAKSKIKKGLYEEAIKDIKEALELEPRDAEAKVIHAKIKTLQ